MEEKQIKTQGIGEVSSIIYYTDKTVDLDSKFFDISKSIKELKPKDTKLYFGGLDISLALDDIIYTSKGIDAKHRFEEIYDLIKTCKTPEDFKYLETYLNKAAEISTVGKNALKIYHTLRETQSNEKETTNEVKDTYNKYFDGIFDEITTRIQKAEIYNDEINQRPDTDKYDEMISIYNKLIDELKKLESETYTKIAPEKRSKIDEQIDYLKTKIAKIKEFVKFLEESSMIL